jgi:hypothetical protein
MSLQSSRFPVVLDSCVLYPMYLRDTLLRAAEAGLYRVHWSQEILDGALRNTDLLNVLKTSVPNCVSRFN